MTATESSAAGTSINTESSASETSINTESSASETSINTESSASETVTPPSLWADALCAHDPRPLDPSRWRRLVVVAAHPDDETLACAGLLHRAHGERVEIEIVVATDGEAAFDASPGPDGPDDAAGATGADDRASDTPDSARRANNTPRPDDRASGADGGAHGANNAVRPDGRASDTHDGARSTARPDDGAGGSARERLGRARRRELADALDALGLGGVRVRWLGLPDSDLRAEPLAGRLAPLLAGADAYLAPWSHDPHPDHRAAGQAAAAAAGPDTEGWEYPIWLWPWRTPDDPAIRWDRAFRHDLDPAARAAKRAAVARFTSQLAPAPGGGDPILPADVLAHFDTGRELFFRAPRASGAPASHFARRYRDGGGDPWQTRTSWYEQRKRAVLLAALPRPRYRHAAEPGCGTGMLTRELAARCDRIDASDYLSDAVAAARTETAGLPHVHVDRAALPSEAALPSGVDLAVLSEVLYYLGPPDLDATVERLLSAVVPGGDVVLVHWRGWPADAPHEAAAVHDRLRAHPDLDELTAHVDTDFLLHVLRRR